MDAFRSRLMVTVCCALSGCSGTVGSTDEGSAAEGSATAGGSATATDKVNQARNRGGGPEASGAARGFVLRVGDGDVVGRSVTVGRKVAWGAKTPWKRSRSTAARRSHSNHARVLEVPCACVSHRVLTW
jgi:hypothetical protein